VQEIRRTKARDKARAAGKNKGSKASGSSTMNDDALTRLMVTEMIAQEKEERLAFIKIKRRKVKCREREVAAQKYRARQEDIRPLKKTIKTCFSVSTWIDRKVTSDSAKKYPQPMSVAIHRYQKSKLSDQAKSGYRIAEIP
ncbi:hypothetical protein Tco_1009610, partial [Tanacetum coccineum]